MNLYEYLKKQLDELSLFQILAHEKIYQFIKERFPYSVTKNNLYIPNKYDFKSYQSFYFKSILLLGISYFEAFLDDIILNCQKSTKNKSLKKPRSYKDRIEQIGKLKLQYNDDSLLAYKAFLIRNCYSHNKGKVSKKLNSSFPEFKLGSDVIVTNEILDEMGIHARKIGKELYDNAVLKYQITE